VDALQAALVMNRQQAGILRAGLEPSPAVTQARTAREALINEATAILDGLIARADQIEIEHPPQPDGIDDCPYTKMEQCDEEYWLANEGLTSERQFHSKLYYLVSQLGSAYSQDDLAGVNHVLRSIVWVNKLVEEEPLQSVYTTGLILGMLNLARYLSDHFEIQSGYRVLQHCALLLEAKRERRKALGLAFRPDSECWYRLYEILAELKWKGPEHMRDLLMTPAMLIEDFRVVEQRCFDYLDRNPSSDTTRNQRVTEALLWCRLQIIKMAVRLEPGQIDALINEFNDRHGALLSTQPGEFMSAAQVDRSQAWYWDFELFKWCTLGEATEEEAMMCHQWRLDAMRSHYSTKCCLKTYERATKRELEYLLQLTPALGVSPGG